MEGLTGRPGYRAWVEGEATRLAMQHLNQEAGYPCYCAHIWSGYCDFCTGLAALDGARAADCQLPESVADDGNIAKED